MLHFFYLGVTSVSFGRYYDIVKVTCPSCYLVNDLFCSCLLAFL